MIFTFLEGYKKKEKEQDREKKNVPQRVNVAHQT